ncbi:uncharacterized protein LJ206_011603 [Theristicus caerulescens]
MVSVSVGRLAAGCLIEEAQFCSADRRENEVTEPGSSGGHSQSCSAAAAAAGSGGGGERRRGAAAAAGSGGGGGGARGAGPPGRQSAGDAQRAGRAAAARRGGSRAAAPAPSEATRVGRNERACEREGGRGAREGGSEGGREAGEEGQGECVCARGGERQGKTAEREKKSAIEAQPRRISSKIKASPKSNRIAVTDFHGTVKRAAYKTPEEERSHFYTGVLGPERTISSYLF